MADGKWVMTEDDARRVDLSHEEQNITDLRKLPNYGQHRAVDDRRGDAKLKCAFCGSEDLQTGFGGCGEGFGYKSFKCRACGGTSDFVFKDEHGKFF
jgi:hypothetical protein